MKQNAIAKQGEFALAIPGKITRTGLELPKNLTIAQWQSVGRVLSVSSQSVHWWIGDWLNYGESKYGESYAVAIDETGFEYGTVANDKYVAGQIELSRRRENLSWSHHYEVAALDPNAQDKWLDKAEKEGWTRKDLRNEIKQATKSDPVFPKGKYRVIYADPPWSYNDQRLGTVEGGGATGTYPTMELEAICNLAVADLAFNDSVLFLWVTSPLLPDGLSVMSAWGFEYKASFVWDKIRGFNGHYNDVRHELLLVGVKGSCLPDVSELPDSVMEIEKSKHSKKPADFRKLIDSLYTSGPRIELFAREKQDGWDAFGNEV